jgi:quinol monooxygenase YgiN
MPTPVSWHVELAVKPGQLEPLRALTAEMIAAARIEPGTLSYERFASDDGQVVHARESYADSEAALAHLRVFTARFAARLASLIDRRRFLVFGDPSAELRKVLDGFGATYFAAFGDDGYDGPSLFDPPR